MSLVFCQSKVHVIWSQCYLVARVPAKIVYTSQLVVITCLPYENYMALSLERLRAEKLTRIKSISHHQDTGFTS